MEQHIVQVMHWADTSLGDELWMIIMTFQLAEFLVCGSMALLDLSMQEEDLLGLVCQAPKS